MSIRVLVAASLSLTGASVHADKVQAATIKPVISSFLAAPKKLPYAGGVVVLVATVKNATTCTFGGAFTKRVAPERCGSG